MHGHPFIHMPPFPPDEPELWFMKLEANFRIWNITNDFSKYCYTITLLDIDILKHIRHLLRFPPKAQAYKAIKSALCSTLMTVSKNGNTCDKGVQVYIEEPSPREEETEQEQQDEESEDAKPEASTASTLKSVTGDTRGTWEPKPGPSHWNPEQFYAEDDDEIQEIPICPEGETYNMDTANRSSSPLSALTSRFTATMTKDTEKQKTGPSQIRRRNRYKLRGSQGKSTTLPDLDLPSTSGVKKQQDGAKKKRVQFTRH